MRRATLFLALLAIAACSSKKDPPGSGKSAETKPVDPAPAAAKPVDPAPAAAKPADPAPAAAKPADPAPAAAKPAAEDDNGGIRELTVYGAGPDGKPEAYARYQPAAGETLLGADDKVASWIPGSGNGGAGDESMDVAVVGAAGKAEIVFAPEKNPRAILPLAIAAGDVDATQVLLEERGQHRAMVRVAARSAAGSEGDLEAYLISWDAKAHAPVVVEHYQGKTDKLPAWATPAR